MWHNLSKHEAGQRFTQNSSPEGKKKARRSKQNTEEDNGYNSKLTHDYDVSEMKPF
jgi:hypothetical protein